VADLTGSGDEICGRCLIQPDSRTAVFAVKAGFREIAPDMNPRLLKLWAQEKAYVDNCRFEINDTTGRILALSTWHGDPVCSYHLYVLADAEMRNNYR
jgi:hypothetical protein